MGAAAPFLIGLGKAILVGAAIGAVVGGLAAAITGGDIGKGILTGAIGGAVSGAIFYGVTVGISAVSSAGSGVSSASEATAYGSYSGGEYGGASGAGSAGGAGGGAGGAGGGAGEGGFFSDLWGSMKTEFSGTLGQQAVSGAIQGATNIYAVNKQADATSELQDKAHQQNLEAMAQANQEAMDRMKLQAELGLGGGGGGGGLSLEDQIALAKEERETILAKVDAELNAQKQLKEQDFAGMAASRERAAAGAGGTVVGGGDSTPRLRSRSQKTIVDFRDDLRNESTALRGTA
jgi:hypothetical protein